MAYRIRDDATRAAYKSYEAEDEYEYVSGVIYLPKAESPPTDPEELAAWSPVVEIKLHEPYRRRIVRVKAEKEGQPPILPHPSSSGRFGFAGGSVVLSTPQINIDGVSGVFSAAASFEFVEKGSTEVFAGYILTSPPMTLETELLPSLTPSQLAAPTNETAPGPSAGENLGKRIDVTKADWGLTRSGGIWPIPEYWPSEAFSKAAVASEDSAAPPTPP